MISQLLQVAAIARNIAPPPELPPGVTLQSRSRSSKVNFVAVSTVRHYSHACSEPIKASLDRLYCSTTHVAATLEA